jgi:hypothetical protein
MLACTLSSTLLATVQGRYVWFGNALSEKMELREFEVYSGGKNVILKRPEVFTRGLDYWWYMLKRDPDQKAQAARMLTDGDLEVSQRVSFGSKIGGGYLDIALRYSSLELDLGEEMPIDRIAIYRSRFTGKVSDDLGWRLLVVLDEQRRIVSWEAFNVYGTGWNKPENQGCSAFDMQPAQGVLAGKVVPAGAQSWISEAEYIRDCLGKPVVDLVKEMTPDSEARLKRFQSRNEPAEVAALGKHFFRRVDLDSPGLEPVKALVADGKYAEALEAFKAPFLASLESLKDWNGGEGTSIYVFYSWSVEPDCRATCRSRDLRAHMYGDRKDLVVKRFVPGLLPPAKFEFPMQTRPLLLNYAVSGDVSDLRLWEEMTDDWAMGFQDAADQDSEKLRDYFVLTVGTIRSNLKDFYNVARVNPQFVKDLSGATLARFLLPILEEIPVANWRVARKVSFNHTYNCIPGGLEVAELLPQFHAGQRLERELRQDYEKLYTYNQYRDGSMVEVGDEGHYLAPIWSPANLYGTFEHKGRPAWFTSALETYFLDNYRANLRSQLRNTSPCGAHVRWNANVDKLLSLEYELGTKDPYWRNGAGSRMAWGDYYPVICKPILEEPLSRAIVDTVYGRGREFTDKNKLKEQEAVAGFYGGEYQGPPQDLVSDWMPYTGLWYFRRGWQFEDSFLHMVAGSTPNNLGNIRDPLTNRYAQEREQLGVTGYRFYDYATPLLTGIGLCIDGLPACPQEGLAPSGSKQDNFSQAPEKPQSGRWYTDDDMDFGEAVYQGPYRFAKMDFDHKLRKSFFNLSDEQVRDVTTTRQILQVRPARLFLQVDRVRYATPEETHTNVLEDTVILTVPPEETGKELSVDQLQVFPDEHRFATNNPGNAGVSVAWFGQPNLEVTRDDADKAHGSFGKLGGPTITMNGYRQTTGRAVRASWQAKGESVLISVLRGQRPDETPVQKLDDLSTDAAAGVRATMADGVTVTLLVARQIPAELVAGEVKVTGEALMLVSEAGKSPYGLALGATECQIGGRKTAIPGSDFRFVLGDAKRVLGLALGDGIETTPIHRPIDPPHIGPDVNVFTDTMKVTITSETPDVEIYYIAEPLDDPAQGTKLGGPARASVNATNWQRYRRPFTIDESTFVRARAFRKGVTEVPATAAGTDATAISYGFFTKRAMRPALADAPARRTPGLNWDYLEDRWFALWTYTDQLDPKTTGTTPQLLDVSMRQTDGPFAVRYHGYLEVPEDGVYTFYGPKEYVNNICEPGYDLRMFVDGEEWYLGQTWHAHGTWSIPLAKGTHRFRVTFADARAKDLENQRVDLWRHYPYPATTWQGTVPTVEVSGPDLSRQPIPSAWLSR